MNVLTKICNICGKELELEMFHKNKNGKYGRNGDCKDCYNAKRKKQNEQKPVSASKHNKWREKNQKENNVFYWNMRARKVNENAFKRYGIVQKVIGSELKTLYDSLMKCSYCDIPLLNNECHIDHVIPLVEGGENLISNLTISCPKCNTTKNHRNVREFYEYVRTIYMKLKPFYE